MKQSSTMTGIGSVLVRMLEVEMSRLEILRVYDVKSENISLLEGI